MYFTSLIFSYFRGKQPAHRLFTECVRAEDSAPTVSCFYNRRVIKLGTKRNKNTQNLPLFYCQLTQNIIRDFLFLTVCLKPQGF